MNITESENQIEYVQVGDVFKTKNGEMYMIIRDDLTENYKQLNIKSWSIVDGWNSLISINVGMEMMYGGIIEEIYKREDVELILKH